MRFCGQHPHFERLSIPQDSRGTAKSRNTHNRGPGTVIIYRSRYPRTTALLACMLQKPWLGGGSRGVPVPVPVSASASASVSHRDPSSSGRRNISTEL